jgi:hypothetical protein
MQNDKKVVILNYLQIILLSVAVYMMFALYNQQSRLEHAMEHFQPTSTYAP